MAWDIPPIIERLVQDGMKRFCGVVASLCVLGISLWGQERPAPESKRIVMTWVPPYAVEKCAARLRENFGDRGMKDGLTHLGLQFWTPTLSGGVERPHKTTNDATVKELRDWAHSQGIRVMLCVYNGGKIWDWPLARAGFAGHPKEFADNLIAEMERLGLDGVDLDLEGNGDFEKDKEAYVRFVGELSRRLRQQGKQLTVDSFSYKWNAPNQGWWKDLLPLVDGLTTMGYEEIGAHASEWRAYEAQCAASGPDAAKLMIGMPTDKSRWQGGEALDHLKWVREEGRVGVALWDAQLPSPAWRTKEMWAILGSIRRK
jgi:hypothetical protein